MCSELDLHSNTAKYANVDKTPTTQISLRTQYVTSARFVLTQIVAKKHFFDLSDAVVTFVAHNSFGWASIGEICKTLTQRFLTDINVKCQWQEFMPFPPKKSPTWASQP